LPAITFSVGLNRCAGPESRSYRLAVRLRRASGNLHTMCAAAGVTVTSPEYKGRNCAHRTDAHTISRIQSYSHEHKPPSVYGKESGCAVYTLRLSEQSHPPTCRIPM
jgi:hypothetical protein